MFSEWGPARGIQLQPLPDVAAEARSPIHKTRPAVLRGGGASVAPLHRVKVFLGAPGGGGGGSAQRKWLKLLDELGLKKTLCSKHNFVALELRGLL